MKVYLGPKATEASGGMYRVLDGLYKHLPVEISPVKEHADVIHSQIALFETMPADIPLVVSSHGLLWKEHGWGVTADKTNAECMKSYLQADQVTAPSAFVARAIARHTLLTPTVVRHGIDLEEWQPQESLGYVLWNKSRVDVANNPRDVNILAEMASNKSFVSTFGVETRNVVLTGRLPADKMKHVTAQAGVYLDTPLESGGPCYGILEAFACGVPVLSWNWGGSAEAVVHQETGYLAEVGNYDDLLGGLNYCFQHRERLGTNARQAVIDYYQWKDIALEYVKVYEKALQPYPVKVSVVIPSYNLGRFLENAVNSVLEQNVDLEVIIVNDASVDNTQTVAESFTDPRVKVINNPANVHVAEARNIGVRASRGKYVLPLDADDRLFPNALEAMVAELDQDRSLHIIAGHLVIFHESDLTKGQESGWPNTAEVALQITGYNRLPYCSLYRRNVWENVGGYRRRIRTGVEDADFWTRALSFGYKAKIIPQMTLKYTTRDNSLGKQNAKGAKAYLPWFGWYYDPKTVPAGSGLSTVVSHLNMPRVSVIIPVGPDHLFRLQTCIDSLLAQTEDNWEVIAVNDTGKSWKDSPYIKGMPFVRFIDSDTNCGVACARNKGIKAALSDRIVFLDADDVAQPHMLTTLIKAQDEADGWIYSDWYIYDGEEIKPSQADDWDYVTFVNRMLAPVTGIYWKKHILAVDGFDEHAPGWEDWDFQLKLLQNGVCGTRVASPLLTYNMQAGKRREDNFARKEELLQYIDSRHKNLRGRIMGCGSCGGKKTVEVQSLSKPEDYLKDKVLIQYSGLERQTARFNSPNHRGVIYLREGTDPFPVFKDDVDHFLRRVDFKLAPAPAVAQIKTSEEALFSQEQPLPEAKIELDDITMGILAKSALTLEQVKIMSDDSLLKIKGIGPTRLFKIRQALHA
jgi:glycosyltransferase involved in cell wall biosynthesis